MVKNKKGKKNPALRKVVVRLLVMLAVTMALAGGAGALLSAQKVQEERMILLAQCITGFVSILASAVASAKAQEKKLLHGLLTTCLYALTLLICNLLFFGAGYENLLPVGLSILAAGLAGGILGSMKRKKRRFV